MNITVIYPNKRKTKSVTYGIAHSVIDKLLCGDELYEFYLPQDMPHVCVGCYACFGGHPEKCGGYEYIKKIIEANPQSVADYKAGKERALGFLVGQAMKETKGKANPQMLNKMFTEELKK